jgi:hypothetical protein
MHPCGGGVHVFAKTIIAEKLAANFGESRIPAVKTLLAVGGAFCLIGRA